MHATLLSLRRGGPVAIWCAIAFAAGAQERGKLIAAEAGGDAAVSSVDLIGDRPLSFTTMKLRSPPRVVVDFADTELAGVPRELSIDDGTLRRVATAAAGQRTARVVIELVAEAEFEVRAQGDRVQVRVPRASPLATAADGQPAGAAGAGPPPAADAAPPPRGAPAGEAVDGAALGAPDSNRLPPPAAAPKAPPAIASAKPGSPRAPSPAGAAKTSLAGSRHAITGIGFRPVGAGEVIVRSDQPLEYGVTGEESWVLLHLPSAAIPLANNRRALDTRFFAGPVARVVPLATAAGTDVRIELRSRAEYQLAQSGGVLTLTFTAAR